MFSFKGICLRCSSISPHPVCYIPFNRYTCFCQPNSAAYPASCSPQKKANPIAFTQTKHSLSRCTLRKIYVSLRCLLVLASLLSTYFFIFLQLKPSSDKVLTYFKKIKKCSKVRLAHTSHRKMKKQGISGINTSQHTSPHLFRSSLLFH